MFMAGVASFDGAAGKLAGRQREAAQELARRQALAAGALQLGQAQHAPGRRPPHAAASLTDKIWPLRATACAE
jgi:hypothetical protein